MKKVVQKAERAKAIAQARPQPRLACEAADGGDRVLQRRGRAAVAARIGPPSVRRSAQKTASERQRRRRG